MATLTAPLPIHESPLALVIRWLAVLAAVIAITMSSIGIALGVVEIIYRDTIYPGLTVQGIDLSGLRRAQAVDRLSREFGYPQTPSFTFRYQDRAWTATPAQLGLTFAVEETAARAYAYGRSGDGWLDFQDQFWAWYEGTDIAPVVLYEPSRAADRSEEHTSE